MEKWSTSLMCCSLRNKAALAPVSTRVCKLEGNGKASLLCIELLIVGILLIKNLKVTFSLVYGRCV